jgi:hypothetical protein
MAAWIPDRPLGYSAEDYRNMPFSQQICLILCKLLLLLAMGVLYAFLTAGLLALSAIMFAITWYLYETFGILCGLVAFAISLYAIANFTDVIDLCSSKPVSNVQELPRPSENHNGLGLGDIIIISWLWKHLTK